MTDYEKQLHDALGEVMDWISNWDPPFVQDDEWPDTERKATNALIGFTAPAEEPTP